MGVCLRKAGVADCEAIHRIQIAAFKALLDKYQDFDISPGAESLDSIRRRFDFPEVDHYFIELDGERIGNVRVRRISGDTQRLSSLCILPEHQGHGYAQAAIKRTESLYPGAKHWTLDTVKQEPKLRHLYEKMGYRLTGAECRVKEGMDLVEYEK